MIVEIMRYGFGLESTLARMYLDRKLECFILEDAVRAEKIPGKTAIPTGTFQLDVRHGSDRFGYYDERWSWHDGMLWLRDVPDFTHVYIHPGNDDEDTRGCPLTGTTPHITPEGEFEVRSSVDAYRKAYIKIRSTLRVEEVEVVVMNDPNYAGVSL